MADDGFTEEVVNPETLEFKRAIKDITEAYSIYKKLEYQNRVRNFKAAQIEGQFNDRQPWDPNKLKSAGEGWRNNRCTGFFSSLIKRAFPPYIQAVDDCQYLTSSALEGDDLDTLEKSQLFQAETTNCIRKWRDWRDFVQKCVREDVIQGMAPVYWTDTYDWHPRVSRQDEVLFPDGSPQNPQDIPMWCLKQNYLIHELAEKLEFPDLAEDVGWDVSNLVKAINNALPENRKTGTNPELRKFEDTIHESTVGRSYSEGVKVIETVHMFAQEPTGQVSHYILNSKTGDKLFTHFDRFDDMTQCLRLFTLEIGNDKLYGSKGAGRILYNTAIAAEQARNLIADSLYLSGLLLLKSKNKNKTTAAISVVHPVCVIGEDFDIVPQKFEVNVDAFIQLDAHLTQIAELQIGAFMPGQILDSQGEKRSASEVNYIASIEQQIKDGLLKRFFGQLQLVIWEMQKRIYSEDNIQAAWKKYRDETSKGIVSMTKKMLNFMIKIYGQLVIQKFPRLKLKDTKVDDAITACYNLLAKGILPEQIFEMAQSNPMQSLQDITQTRTQNMALFKTQVAGDPSFNQQNVKKDWTISLLGTKAADRYLIPEEDNTLKAEAIRMQFLELTSLLAGEQVPISPRDSDIIHLGVIQEKTGDLMKTITPQSVTPQTLSIASNIVDHAKAHLISAQGKGIKGKEIDDAKQFIETAEKIITGAKNILPSQPQVNGAKLPPGVHPHIPSQKISASQALTDDQQTNPQAVVSSPGTMPLAHGPTDMIPAVQSIGQN